MIKVGVVGATGYTGAELLRIIEGHSDLELLVATSRAEQGRAISDFFPSLRGKVNLDFSESDSEILKDCDVVFFATPNTIAMQQVPGLLEAGVRVIDLSADFRLTDVDEWEKWYGIRHACPDLVKNAVYGLTEINREKIKDARLVANPGCYPTAIQLGFIPLLEANIVKQDSLIADAKSGISGAGRKANMSTQYCETADSFNAYSVAGHRHLPEIKQGLERVTKSGVGLVFVPHLTPMIRGIHATLYACLTSRDTDLQLLFENRYDDEKFVDVLPAGSHPNTSHVRGTNMCRLAVHQPQGNDTVVVLAVEDNLVKGAAGQAIQNMNIMFGLDETTGLLSTALSP